MKKTITFFVFTVMLCFVFAACGDKTSTSGGDSADTPSQAQPSAQSSEQTSALAENTLSDKEHSRVKFTMSDGKSFVIELYDEYAPETCANFESLVKSGFYNSKNFHRICPGFMAQGGSSDGIGVKGSDKTIKGEFASNGVNNTLSHTRGVVSMARIPANPDSASSQFFICYGDESFLDGDYAAFGKVVEGMEVVDAFAALELFDNASGEKSTPVNPPVIKSAEIVNN